MRPRFRTYEDILAQQAATLRVHSGVNLPLREGDVLRSELEASSLADADQFIQTVRMPQALSLEGAVGDELRERALELGTPALLKSKATVSGVFRRVVGSGGLITIPAGTTVFIPATPATSAIEFLLTIATTIADGAPQSPVVSLDAVLAGSTANGITVGTLLVLKVPITNCADFQVTVASGGGRDDETDDALRARARIAPQQAARATKTALEGAVRGAALAAGGVVTTLRVIENFRTGITEIYIDNGSGVEEQIGPTIASQTYRHTAVGGEIYVLAEQLIGVTPGASRFGLLAGFPFITITSVTRDPLPYGGAVAQVLGVDYWVDKEAGICAFNVPLAASERVDVTMTTYGGLVEEVAKVVRGQLDNAAYKGYRGASMPFRVRPPSSLVVASIAGVLTTLPGYDADYGRNLAAQSILGYVNALDVGEAARYARIIDIAMNAPGASNFVLTSITGDIAPTTETGVVRATSVNIT